MIVVLKKKGESKDGAFRKFTRMFIDEEIVDEMRARMYYLKPSQKKKADAKQRIKSLSKSRRGRTSRTTKR